MGGIGNFDTGYDNYKTNYHDITKCRLTTCSTVSHTHKCFKGMKVDETVPETPTTTRSDYYNTISICKPTFLAYCSIRQTKNCWYQLTRATTTTVTSIRTQM